MPGDDTRVTPSEPAFEARLHAGEVDFGDRDATLLRAVGEHGSLNAATGSLGRSYSRAHGRLSRLEEAFGPLVERTRGGEGGGGSRLTDRAHELLARFERLRTAFSGVASADETVFEGSVVARDGELATVRTPVGVLRVLAPHDADSVQVSVRADAVTLTSPADTPDAEETSARNRLSGTVVGLERGAAVAKASLDVGGETPLRALLTIDSADRLGLEPGVRVVATFKATATRATPTSGSDR